jgi:hypothetical protein
VAPAAPASAAAASSGVSTPTDDPPEPAKLPTSCADPAAAVCVPPSNFVDRLCERPHQDIALALFAKSSPFTRMYMRGKMDELVFDEEILALRFHGVPKGGMQVGNSTGSYDVLRWDGSCSMAVDAGMIGTTAPPRPKTARVLWSRLSEPAQNALIAGSDGVKRAHAKHGKECKGASSGDVSSACEKADGALVDAVVDFVRQGGTLPTPNPP